MKGLKKMFDDIFKGTDFGNIKGEVEKNEEESLIENAAKKGIWHTGKKQNIWSVGTQDKVWDVNDGECGGGVDDCNKESSCGSGSSGPSISSGAFDDIF